MVLIYNVEIGRDSILLFSAGSTLANTGGAYRKTQSTGDLDSYYSEDRKKRIFMGQPNVPKWIEERQGTSHPAVWVKKIELVAARGFFGFQGRKVLTSGTLGPILGDFKVTTGNDTPQTPVARVSGNTANAGFDPSSLNTGLAGLATLKSCTRQTPHLFPDYILKGGIIKCPDAILTGQECTLTCDGEVKHTISCGPSGGALTGQVTCPPRPAGPQRCPLGSYTGYQALNFGNAPNVPCPAPLEPDGYCIQDNCPNGAITYIKCDGTTGRVVPTSVACPDTTPPPITAPQSITHTTPLPITAPQSITQQGTCTLDAKYSGYKFYGQERNVSAQTRDTLAKLPSCPSGPSALSLYDMCLDLECNQQKRKAVKCLDDGNLHETTEGCDPVCARPDGYETGYTYYIESGPTASTCPIEMAAGSSCIQTDCAGNMKKKVMCGQNLTVTQEENPCSTDPVVDAAAAARDAQMAQKDAEQLGSKVEEKENDLSTIDNTIDTLTKQAADPANAGNGELLKRIADLQRDMTETENELKEMRTQHREAVENAEAAATRAENAAKANGGAAPSVAETSLQCGELKKQVPVWCEPTAVSSLVSIKRGTFTVPVTIYEQGSGLWGGYGIAKDAPWKGVYVSTRVPNSVTCVWDKTPHEAISYEASVPRVTGAVVEYVLTPTARGSTATEETTMTLITGPNPFATSPQTTSAPVPKADGLSVGEIAGIVVGSVCGFFLLVFLLYFLKKRQDKGPSFSFPLSISSYSP